MQLNEYTALQLGEMIKQGKLGCEELTRYCLDEIASTARLNTCIDVLEQHAVEQAGKVQQRIDDGEDLSPLAGVPMVLKDNISTKGIRTTCASKMLAGFKPIYDATAYTRLQKAGAILIAKANMDEFAMGGSTETSYFGPTCNPWDTERVPGGSSGGTAAAVAAGQTPFGLGSDTGGSIRQPCAFCGCSGIKPTYGSVSRYGLIAYASSMDQIGPIGRDMMDCAAVLNLIQGRDERDSTSVDAQPLDMDDIRKADIQGITIGIPDNYLQEGLDDSVRQSVLDAARVLEGEGAKLVSIHLPVDYAIPSYYIVACAEASSNLSRYDGIKYGYSPGSTSSLEQLYIEARSEGFGMEVKRRIMIGAYVLSSGYYDAYYKKAMQARKLIMGGFEQAFGQCDAILSPTTPTTAYRLGENASDPLKMYLGDIYTAAVNLAGLPAAALPCGFADGMPVGMQIIGRHFDEQTILKLGHRFQLATDYHSSRPGRVENGKERTHEI